MLRIITKSILLTLSIAFTSKIISQPVQHIITYSSSGLSTVETCNSFNNLPSPAVINSFTHYPVSGGVTFDGTNLILKTQYGTTTSTNFGTAYSIAFPFKNGYSYSFKVDGKGTDGSGGNTNFPYIQMSLFGSLPNPNQTNPTACGAVNENSWSGLSNGLLGGFFTSQNTATYNIAGFNSTSTATGYIMILAKGGSSGANTALISKVTIVETPITPSFTLTPNSVNITCGQTVSQTFTVNNLNSTSGVTSYVWNLGANNGWIYNGSAASSTITTSTSTLNLTSTSCVNIGSLSARAVIGSTNYNTNTSTVNNIAPTLTVFGADNICSGSETYTVNNLPCSASVSWDVSPANNTVIETRVGNQITLQRNGTSNGNLTLTATITNVCGGSPIIISKQNIIVGTERPINYTICGYDPNDGCRYPKILFSVYTTYPAGSTYKWYIGNSLIATTTTPSWTYNLNPGSCDTYMELSVIVTTTCGDSYPAGEEIFYACESGFRMFSASPNPTTGDVQIEATGTDKTTTIKEIQVTDKFGNVKKIIKLSTNPKKHKINIADLPADTYIIRIYDGKTWTSKKVIKS